MSHTRRPLIPALMIAIGLASTSVALGLIYRDLARQDLAREMLALESNRSPADIDSDELWDAWDPGYWLGALASGTLGVTAFGAGATLVLYDTLAMLYARRRLSEP